jgi:hypothetical protein
MADEEQLRILEARGSGLERLAPRGWTGDYH